MLTHLFRKLMLAILAVSPYFASSQKITITGQVLDDGSEEAVPFANVYLVRDPNAGTSTDMDGNFTFTFAYRTGDSLEVSALGYETRRKAVPKTDGAVINYRMKTLMSEIAEVVVLAGENPANAVVRNIIKHKDANNRYNYDAFKVEAYSKLEMDMDNIDSNFQKKKIMKPFAFVFENIDSFSDVKPFLPAYMMETMSDLYWLKKDGLEKEMPKARKVSGIENESVIELIGSMQQKFNVYDSWFNILGKQFISPFNGSALAYYEFYIIDSMMVKDRWSYKLKFKPKRAQENTFFGDFWVDMDNYALEIVNMRMNPEVNINFVERMILYYDAEFYPNHNRKWLPNKEKIIIDFFGNKKGPGVMGRRTTTYRDYQINQSETEGQIRNVNPNNVNPIDLQKADSFWVSGRHEDLSKNEAAVYKMIDSIKNVPVFKTAVDIIQTVVTGYKELGPIEIGPYFKLYSYNAIEGHRFRLGVGTSKKLSKKLYLMGYLAYGTKDESFKYGGEIQWTFSKRKWTILEATYKDDVELHNDNSEAIGEENILAGLYRRQLPWKLMRARELKLSAERHWGLGWSNRITLMHRHMDPYDSNGADSMNVFPFAYRVNPADPARVENTVEAFEAIFKTRYAFKEKFVTGNFTRRSLGSKFPILEFQYTVGLTGENFSQDYHKIMLGLTHKFNVPPVGWIRYNIKAGKVFGDLPYLLLHVHTGNETYFYQKSAFNAMNRYEFVSDQFVEANIEHHWDGFFLNYIPLLRKLKWREVAGFRMAYGSLSAANAAANILNNYDRTRTDYEENPDISEGAFYGTFDKYKPYMEASFGIENIFKFFRIDCVWRLNYNENRWTNPFTVRGTIQFNF